MSPSTIARGTFRRGSRTSPATQVMYTHPSYAQNTAINPTPRAEISSLRVIPIAIPAPLPAWYVKLLQCPLPIANPRITNAPIATNFAQVAAFCRIAPRRRPTTLIHVTITIEISPNTCAFVNATPSTVKMTCFCDRTGKISPRYAADATESAAIVPPLATANSIHPYRNAIRSPKASRRYTYCPPESGNIDPSSANAKAAHIEITAPKIQTRKNSAGCGSGPAISFAVKNIEEPMIPPASNRIESSRDSPRTRLGFVSDVAGTASCETEGDSIRYPIPSSSGDSSGVPQRRQITAAQSPQVSGSVTSHAHCGQ